MPNTGDCGQLLRFRGVVLSNDDLPGFLLTVCIGKLHTAEADLQSRKMDCRWIVLVGLYPNDSRSIIENGAKELLRGCAERLLRPRIHQHRVLLRNLVTAD